MDSATAIGPAVFTTIVPIFGTPYSQTRNIFGVAKPKRIMERELTLVLILGLRRI